MNIFFISYEQDECAKALDNKRLIKAVLETAQLLSNAMHINHIAGAPYKLTHQNHPCTKWVSTTIGFDWTRTYFYHICAEYEFRYDRRHECIKFMELFNDASTRMPDSSMKRWANPPNVTSFKDEEDVCIAYKKYLLAKWDKDKSPPTWYFRQVPCWDVNRS